MLARQWRRCSRQPRRHRAVEAGRADSVSARLIGVLPRKESVVFEAEQDRQLLIQTRLCSGERNPINSLTSDAVFVLKGDSGTLAELGFALVAGKVCHLVGSAQKLQDAIRSGFAEVQGLLEQGLRKYPTINGRKFTAELILERLDRYLADEAHSLPYPNDANGAEALVDAALADLNADVLLHGSGFPELPGVLSKTDFENWLSLMR
jgi:SLOG cluster4 family